jgi:hypothetical protein
MSAAKPAGASWLGAIQSFASVKNCGAAISPQFLLVGGQDGRPTIPVGVKRVPQRENAFHLPRSINC